MKAKKVWANFSVKDINATNQFYTQLGFTPNNMNDHPKLASFLFGDSDFVIHFFERGSQIDEYLPSESGIKSGEVIFTLAAETVAEVKEWIHKVKEAGGNISNVEGRDETNHFGFAFADPDGHKFNVLLMEQ
jgi:predicted lactoylglutathione lyase